MSGSTSFYLGSSFGGASRSEQRSRSDDRLIKGRSEYSQEAVGPKIICLGVAPKAPVAKCVLCLMSPKGRNREFFKTNGP